MGFSKDYYFENDTLWAKLSIYNGQSHSYSDSSEMAYVKLINSNGDILQQLTLKTVNGQVAFNMILPENKNSSEIRLIAYTNFMRNHDESFQFQKTLRLFSTINIQTKPTAISELPQIKFYPEGGDLVTGLRSKVAFQCLLKSGKGFNIRGKIVDQKNTEITDFQSTHVGIGSFFLSPETGNEYYAVYVQAGQEVKTKLPSAKKTGYTLTVNELLNASKDFLIEINSTINNSDSMTLVVHQRGNLLLNSTFEDDKNQGIRI